MSRRRGGYGAGGWRRRRDGSVELRWHDAEGKRRSRYLPSGTTPRDAQRALAEIHQSAASGVPVGSAAQTVGVFAQRWLREVAPHQLRPRTLERYDGIVRLHIIPSIGGVRLDRLTPDHIAKVHADCRRKTGRGGIEMAPASIRAVHACLRSILRTALERRLLQVNPADAIRPPKAAGKPMEVLKPEEVGRLLEAVHGDEFEALYVLALGTGMRLGELLGLRWQDIDLDAAALSVQVALVRTGKGWFLAEPKTDRSRRNIQLTARSVGVLRARGTTQKRQRVAAGEAWEDLDLVFTDPWGMPLIGAHVTERRFKPMLKRAGLPVLHFHQLRHTAASLMIASGSDAQLIAQQLGHSSIAITMDRYGHLLPGMQRMLADRLASVFGL